MKKIFLLLSLATGTFGLKAQAIINDSATMGPGYINDVHYSLQNGTISMAPNNNWHIGFRSGLQSDGIFINTTNFVKGFLTNKTTAAWATLDSNAATKEVFNTDTSWEIGAFNQTFDNPYCSWGIYNTITHVVTGDSLLLLKVGNNWVKLWVVEKAMGNWTIRVGNDTKDTTFTLKHNDIRMNTLAYLNLNNFSVVMREPLDSTWDIKFTRYAALQAAQGVYYPVTGVLNNRGVNAVKVTAVNKETYLNYASHPFVNSMSAIGADWKSFDNATFQWKMADSTCYFVKAKNGNIWKLWFTGFGGSSNGKSYFNKQKLFTVGLGDVKSPLAQMSVYPNPARETFQLVLDNVALEEANVTVLDLQGKTIYQEHVKLNKGLQTLPFNVAGIENGLYIINIEGNGYQKSQRLLIGE